MIKGIERVTPMLEFDLRGVEVRLHGLRQDSPPKMVSIGYERIIDTDETDHRLELLQTNVRTFGTDCGGGRDQPRRPDCSTLTCRGGHRCSRLGRPHFGHQAKLAFGRPCR